MVCACLLWGYFMEILMHHNLMPSFINICSRISEIEHFTHSSLENPDGITYCVPTNVEQLSKHQTVFSLVDSNVAK